MNDAQVRIVVSGKVLPSIQAFEEVGCQFCFCSNMMAKTVLFPLGWKLEECGDFGVITDDTGKKRVTVCVSETPYIRLLQ